MCYVEYTDIRKYIWERKEHLHVGNVSPKFPSSCGVVYKGRTVGHRAVPTYTNIPGFKKSDKPLSDEALKMH
jgi:hypothetical protein